MKLYLVRHGETLWNTQHRIQGWQDSPLTEKGRADAERLGSSLSGVVFDHAFSSPSGRAADTARLILSKGDPEQAPRLIFTSDLKELGFGSWEGMQHQEVGRIYPDHQHKLWHDPVQYHPVDGETLESLMERARRVMGLLRSGEVNGNVLMVSHAVTIKMLYLVAHERPLAQLWDPPEIKGTSLTVWTLTADGVKVEREADSSHLTHGKGHAAIF